MAAAKISLTIDDEDEQVEEEERGLLLSGGDDAPSTASNPHLKDDPHASFLDQEQ